MSAPVLSPHFVFGVNSFVSGGLAYLDETTILYSAGHNLVLYSLDTRQQRFIPLTDVNGAFGRTEATAIAVSHSRRFIAVAERAAERAIISIFDLRTLKKRRILTCPDVRSREYTSLAFSADSRILISLSGAPEFLSIAWDWQKAKPIQFTTAAAAASSCSAQQISFSQSPEVSSLAAVTPVHGPGLIAVTGRNFLEIYAAAKDAPIVSGEERDREREAEASLDAGPASLSGLPRFQPQPVKGVRQDELDILCHLWLKVPGAASDRSRQLLLLGLGSGSLLAFEGGSLVQTVSTSPADCAQSHSHPIPQPPKAICSLAAYSNGFVAGCDGGLLLVYQFGSSGDLSLVRFFVSDSPSRLSQLALSPNQENLLILTESQQLLSLKSFSTEILNPREVHLNPLIGAFHSGPITGMSTCVRKPIIATCGSDRGWAV